MMKSQSLTLSTDTLKKAMNLAVCGTTGPWQAASTPLDLDWALRVYQPEIDLLNELKTPKNRVSAGMTAAGLLMAAIDPRVLTVLERFSRGKCVHDEQGFDAPGYLMHLMRRVTEIDSFGRNPVYQHYLFQIALAVLVQWLKDQDNGIESRFLATPSAPPLGELLEKVRRLKGHLPMAGGFRPIAELSGRVPDLGPLHIAHVKDEGLVLSMAFRAAEAEGLSTTLSELSATLKRTLAMNIPPELAHPGVLAAAVVDNTLHPETLPQWDALWTGQWQEDHTGSDMAGRIFKKVRDTNRRQIKWRRAKTRSGETPLEMTIDLYRSCRDAARVARQERCLNMRWTAMPQVSNVRDGELAKALNGRWADLDIPEVPELAFLTFAPPDAPPPQKAHMKAAERVIGNRQETGRLAEQYFKAHHASIDPRFAGECIDKTTSGEGHDFQTVSALTARTWVEVKGTAGPTGGVEMTLPEWVMAQRKGDDYYLVIVRNLAGSPYTEVIPNPAKYLGIRQRSYTRKEIRIHASERQIRDALQRSTGQRIIRKKGKKAA